jgi:hypothetical protein
VDAITLRFLWKYIQYVYKTNWIAITSSSAHSRTVKNVSNISASHIKSTKLSKKSTSNTAHPILRQSSFVFDTISSLIPFITVIFHNTMQSWQHISLCVLLFLLVFGMSWISVQILFAYNLFHFLFVIAPLFVYIIVFYGLTYCNVRKWKRNDSSDKNNRKIASTNLATETNTLSTAQKLEALNVKPVYQFILLLYSAFETTYYAALFPMGFVREHIYFDKTMCLLQTFFVFANMLLLLSLQLLSTHFFRFICHKHTFGCWKVLSKKTYPTVGTDEQIVMEKVEPWSSKYRTSYKKGDLVSYNDTIYVAVGANQNCGIPGSIPDLVVYTLFEKPENVFSYLICFQGAIVVFQMIVFIRRQSQVDMRYRYGPRDAFAFGSRVKVLRLVQVRGVQVQIRNGQSRGAT